MNKYDMSLSEYANKFGIDKEHPDTTIKAEPTDLPKKAGHDTKIYMITEDLERTTISDTECSVCMYGKKETNYDCQK